MQRLEKETYSFIVPVYNVEKYLPACIESIYEGMTREDEMILVDDGSTDCSGTICDEFSKLHHNVKTVHQERGGVSSARNIGIGLSSKKWIVFVDSDDYLDRSYRDLFDEEINDEYDIFFFSIEDCCEADENKRAGYAAEFDKEAREKLVKGSLGVKQESYTKIANGMGLTGLHGKVIRRSVIVENSIEFPLGVFMGEDSLFMTRILSVFDKAKYIDKKFYHYRYNTESVSYRYKPDLGANMAASDKYMEKWLTENPQYMKAYQSYRLGAIILHLRDDFFHSENRRSDAENRIYVKQILRECHYKESYEMINGSAESKCHPLSKRVVFWLAVHGQYYILKWIYKLRYGSRADA